MNVNSSSPASHSKYRWDVCDRPVLITGGAGFIGSNVADALLQLGQAVIIYDNLSRPGVQRNLEWLMSRHGSIVTPVVADIRDAMSVKEQVGRSSKVFHFAAQVAVTTSILAPVEDFEINARGTFNVLEAIRAQAQPPPLVFTSTNKVYGALDDIPLQLNRERYESIDYYTQTHGISEARSLDFHSPYGCSKGAADQYVIDSVRSHGLEAVVFRMSCIYGPRQFGTEDQGWVAHFLIKALNREPITLYGDGCQVRDILYVDDLVRAMLTAQNAMEHLSGQAFNIGGGAANTISLLELLEFIHELTGNRPVINFEDWRVGDQRYFVADTRKFRRETNWKPEVDAYDGIRRLYNWLVGNSTQPIIGDKPISTVGSAA